MTEKDEAYYFHQTPVALAQELINATPLSSGDKVLEPFKGEGAFYDNFPEFVEKFWTEKADGKDFRDFTEEVDWAISNPPYKLDHEVKGKRTINAIYTIIKYFSTRVKKGIGFLVNDYALSTLTPNRLRELNNNGLYIHNIIVCSVKKWRGRYYYIIFKKEKSDFYKFLPTNF